MRIHVLEGRCGRQVSKMSGLRLTVVGAERFAAKTVALNRHLWRYRC
ncbi:hypothetical protein KCP73_16885 [Salmonella enterica subsp. enterica]|nr:hypothetical protein KCP73_16885 [Salmonella enterica subsp. enterica]